MWKIIEIEELDEEECNSVSDSNFVIDNNTYVLITIRNEEDGRIDQVTKTAAWINFQEFKVGDDWIDDPDLQPEETQKQNVWISNYMQALEELDD